VKFESHPKAKPAGFDQPNQDEQHLALLSIFHYALGAILGLVSLIPSLHLMAGILMVSEIMDSSSRPPALVGWFIVVTSTMFILGGLAFSFLVAMTGRRIAKRKGHGLCIAIAGIECLFMPLGTVLGVFTIITLMRPSVKVLFGVQPVAKPSK